MLGRERLSRLVFSIAYQVRVSQASHTPEREVLGISASLVPDVKPWGNTPTSFRGLSFAHVVQGLLGEPVPCQGTIKLSACASNGIQMRASEVRGHLVPRPDPAIR